jgi:DNA-binding NtrC family response regulator
MKAKSYRILAIDDDLKWCELLTDVLADEGFLVTISGKSSEASRLMHEKEFDVILTDLKMAGKDGLDVLEETKKLLPETPVILMTAYGSIDSAVQAMKMGAYDYITKSGEMEELIHAVKKAAETRELRKEVVDLKKKLESRYSFHHMIGKSRSMRKIYDLIEIVSSTSSNILITGESGTGKELVAKAIHYSGTRKDGPFVAVNCAAIPETLLESELFGYKKGAFTDARHDKDGLVFKAKEGTLFLDEVTEMSPALQAKLLRVLEEKTVRPLGDTNSYKIDVRVISTSNRNIQSQIQENLFRQDLYYRLRVVDIEIPPLRERKEDIPLLVQHFVDMYSKEMKKKVYGISNETIKILMEYPWPGNVRELENIIQRAITLSCSETIVPENLPADLIKTESNDLFIKACNAEYTLEGLEKEYIRKVMNETKGNRSRTSEILGINRKTLYRKLKEA